MNASPRGRLVALALVLGIAAGCANESPASGRQALDEAVDDSRDLSAIDEAVDGVRLILLGEPSHGDGAVFQFKARLIRYLHQRHGFDVVAFESGQLPMDDVDRALAAPDIALPAAVDLGLLSFWRESAEVLPTFEYVRQTKTTARPITVAGFDNQLTASERSAWLAAIMEPFAGPDAILGNDLRTRVADGFDDFYVKGTRDPSSIRQFSKSLDSLAGVFDANEAILTGFLEGDRASMVRRSMEDARLQADMMAGLFDAPRAFRVEDNNPRDHRMADNLLWLLETRFPGRKVIAWLASAHALFVPTGLVDSTGARPYLGMLPMGEILRSRLGPEVLSIGFSAVGGEYGSVYDELPTSLGAPLPGSVEAAVAPMDSPFHFVNFRALPSGHRLRDFRPARPLGYRYFWARWDRHLDGLYVFRRMTRANRRPQTSR